VAARIAENGAQRDDSLCAGQVSDELHEELPHVLFAVAEMAIVAFSRTQSESTVSERMR
jgi:hypothetical protein